MVSHFVIVYSALHHEFFVLVISAGTGRRYYCEFFLLFQAIYISRITEGGAAEKDGKLQVGDRVTSVCIANFMYCHVLSVVLLVMLYAMMWSAWLHGVYVCGQGTHLISHHVIFSLSAQDRTRSVSALSLFAFHKMVTISLHFNAFSFVPFHMKIHAQFCAFWQLFLD